ncbi:MAG: heat-inducible transcriptional repressor HrcA [Myxococcales bacterium]|nr:heat-inducible transcription repressor HrcA [Myxococcales bacterium]HIK84106.1 heat-inducible transcription repressor HrcA [Myxococcales bacterium]
MPGLPGGAKPKVHGSSSSQTPRTELTERQARVFRALIAAYVGQAGPVSSQTLAQLLPVPLSSASIRNTLSELHEAGLIHKSHASAGRVPTELGLRIFVDDLLEVGTLGPHQQRLLDRSLSGVDAAETPRQASQLLSEYTRQLGFVVAPRVEHQRLKAIHLVAISSERVLIVLVAESGRIIERILDQPSPISQRELEQIGQLLSERVVGRTLIGLRRILEIERDELRGQADEILRRAWKLGFEACESQSEDDLIVATRLALLDQPEFADPGRIRGLFTALETNQRLLDLLRQIAQADGGEKRVGLSMSLGTQLGEPALRDCVLMAVPYGRPAEPDALGVLGVIGPQRMDYGRVIPLVHYCGELVTRKLQA